MPAKACDDILMTDSDTPNLKTLPFEVLVATHPRLIEARADGARQPPAKRRMSAEFVYGAAMADNLFDRVAAISGDVLRQDGGLESGLLALAIDPFYAPALLTVGSVVHQYGRVDEAMEHFMKLTSLSESEPELDEIIEQAGTFLLDQEDDDNAERLYRSAVNAFPRVATYWDGLAYCLSQRGQFDESIRAYEKAVDLGGRDAEIMNDLGWSLVLAGRYDEARTILEEAVSLSSPEYDLPRNNLKELDRRVGRAKSDRSSKRSRRA